VVDVYDAKAFADPVAYLGSRQNLDNRVVEEPGSQGIRGIPDRVLIRKLAREKTREAILAEIDRRIERDYNASQQGVGQARKDAENRLADLVEIRKGIEAIHDRSSAALFYRQNTLRLSHIDFLPKHVHRRGDVAAGGKTYTFHRDAGYIVIQPDALQQANRAAKAEALNGPFGRGFVRGHNAIANMKHRFINHIHVNKGTPEAIDIYDGAPGEGGRAEAWAQKGNLLVPEGMDQQAVAAAIEARNRADLEPN
jgi:hypothetical protein